MSAGSFVLTAAVIAVLAPGCVFDAGSSVDGRTPGPMTIVESAASIPGDEFECRTDELAAADLEPFQLEWAQTYFGGPQWTRFPVFVTCHQSSEGSGSIVRLFLRDSERLHLAATREFSGDEHLEDPAFFTENRHGFLLLTANAGGSAACWRHHVFWLGEAYSGTAGRIEVREVTIESPLRIIESLLGPEQRTDPNRISISWNRHQLRFNAAIWNPGDSHNLPSGGSIDGSFRVMLGADGVPIGFAVDEWVRDADPG